MGTSILTWASKLIGVTPLEKLLAVYIGNNAGPSDLDGREATALDIVKAAVWCCCLEDDVLEALSTLSSRGGLSVEERFVDGRYSITFETAPERLHLRTAIERPCAIYVVTTTRGVKIGVSIELEKRMQALETVAPIEMELIFSATGPAPIIRKIERECHRELAAHNIVGEWFSCPPDVAVSVVKVALFKAGILK